MAIVADIEKAFLQIGLLRTERDVTQFLRLKNPNDLTADNNIQVNCFTRILFGIESSPFILQATIEHHLSQSSKETAMKIRHDFYVENLVTGVKTDEQAVKLYADTKEIFFGLLL